MRRWSGSAAAAVLVLFAASAPRAGAGQTDELAAIEEDIAAWRLEDARSRIDGLAPEARKSPRARYLEGKLLFHEGDNDAAVEALRSAIQEARTQLDWKQLRDRVETFSEVTAGLASKRGADGRFTYRYTAPDDALLVPYADKALAAQLAALSKVFGDAPRARIEVLFVPDVESLAALSGLLPEQIERTGTVGVSKYGRIMVLSPRALASGYPWLDTLGHELAHLFVSRASRDKAPIWLHEGVAKLFEGRWRGGETGALTPEETYLLDRAAREKRLIPLRRLHPSIAALPDQEDAALAYAEVLSLTRYLDARIGPEKGIAALLRRLGEGATIDGALTELTKFNLRRLYLWWEQDVSGRRQTPVSAVGLMQRRYRHGTTGESARLEGDVDEEAARHVRLGDLLRLRGHLAPATAEYRRALALERSSSPRIVERLGGCLIDLRRFEEAAALLAPVAALYPSYTTGFVELGEALTELEKYDEAIAALERAEALNPFDPSVHCLLERCYRARGRADDAKREGEHCLALSAPPPPRKPAPQP
ncbi:MAG: tetratricopeptide repeat protein [Proteobacteria bacterium]|jgi:tetratricopeptide (TPR) repeat protein|nr:tetratricopeptide repeat protein [Pseudomonadota bacterium]